jgi:hypothetical protein
MAIELSGEEALNIAFREIGRLVVEKAVLADQLGMLQQALIPREESQDQQSKQDRDL